MASARAVATMRNLRTAHVATAHTRKCLALLGSHGISANASCNPQRRKGEAFPTNPHRRCALRRRGIAPSSSTPHREMPRPYVGPLGSLHLETAGPYTTAMGFDPAQHHRHSIRLRDHDYGTPAAYFVTVVTVNRDCIFADASLRSTVERCWLAIPWHVTIDRQLVLRTLGKLDPEDRVAATATSRR